MSVQRDGWIDEWTDGHTNCQAGTERGRAQASGASLSPKDPGQNPRASFRWLENHGCPPTLCDRELGVSERARERLNIAQIVSRRIRAQTQVSCLPPTPPPAGGNTKHVPPTTVPPRRSSLEGGGTLPRRSRDGGAVPDTLVTPTPNSPCELSQLWAGLHKRVQS